MVGSKWVPFPLSVHSSSSEQWHFQPREEQRWNKRGQNRHPVRSGVHGETVLAHQFEIQTVSDVIPP